MQNDEVPPNSMAPVIIQGTLAVTTAILEASALGFLGLGAQPSDPEWGKCLLTQKTTCNLHYGQ